ncbi:hypothetical protein WG66_010046 [Moniliophthora roreri]|nr:hypothetical protein WG66_010046 [Moniliophthora roreri]
MASIEADFGIQKTRRHDWYWDSGQKDWIPRYDIELWINRDEMWKEYFSGLSGHISIKELEGRWGQSFWGQQQQNTEYRRRKKLFVLIETLAQERNWTFNRVLEFLREHYPVRYEAKEDYLRTANKFVRWLKDENIRKIVEKAADSE